MSYDLSFDFSSPDESWQLQTSGEGESIELHDDHARLTVGGYPAPVHYARIRQVDNPIPLGELFTIEAILDLPSDFYEKQTGYVRLMGTDNVNIAQDGQVWRIGLHLYSDQFPRLLVQHRRTDSPVSIVWKGAQRLPLGAHKYSLVIRASAANPFNALYIDDALVMATDAKNVPDGMLEAEKIITRQYAGLDGASDYDTGTLSLAIRSLRIYRGMPSRSCLGWLFTI